MTVIQTPRLRHWLLLFTLVVLWGSRYLAVEIALEGYRPLDIVFLQLAVAAVLLWLIMRAAGERLPRDARSWAYFNAMALFGNGLPYFLEAWGQVYLESALVGVLLSVSPLSVLLLAHLMLPDEHATGSRTAAFLVGLAGVVLLIGPGVLTDLGGGAMRIIAQLAVLGAAVCYGLAAVITRLAPQHGARVVAAGVLIAAAVQLLPVWWFSVGLPDGLAAAKSTLAVIAIGVFCVALAALAFFRLIAESGAAFQSLANYLTPLWAVFVGYVALDERLPANAWAALSLILLALWLTGRGGDRKRARA